MPVEEPEPEAAAAAALGEGGGVGGGGGWAAVKDSGDEGGVVGSGVRGVAALRRRPWIFSL
jgi:hypothetical protein